MQLHFTVSYIIFQYPFGRAICRGTLHCTFSFTIKNFYDSTSVFFFVVFRRNEAIGSEHSLWNYFNTFFFFFYFILGIFRIRLLCNADRSQSKRHSIKVTAFGNRIRNYFLFSNVSLNSFQLIKTSMQSLHVPFERLNFENRGQFPLEKLLQYSENVLKLLLFPIDLVGTSSSPQYLVFGLEIDGNINWWYFIFPMGHNHFHHIRWLPIANNNWLFSRRMKLWFSSPN